MQKDSAGVSRSLEYDDHEALLACAWLRTGCWLHPEVTRRLVVELLTPTEGLAVVPPAKPADDDAGEYGEADTCSACLQASGQQQ